jgi:hypothetical protein
MEQVDAMPAESVQRFLRRFLMLAMHWFMKVAMREMMRKHEG